MQIKHNHILVPSRRYQDSRHLLQNLKVPKSVMGFNNHAQRSTPPYYLDVDNPLSVGAFSPSIFAFAAVQFQVWPHQSEFQIFFQL